MGGTKPWPEAGSANKDYTSAAVVVIGAGISGMCTAIDLLKQGIQNFVILEKSGGVGGTWRDQKYPGCCCDVWSLLYSFSFEQNPDWTREYPGQEEILDYLVRTAAKFNLYRYIRFNTEVKAATWDDTDKQWVVDCVVSGGSKDGEFGSGKYTLKSDFLVSAVGQLNQPKWPTFEGMDSFKGKTMHSARWDWTYDLTGKRVAIIGNGATAVQIIPEVAKVAEHLTVFQRTPNWVVARLDAPVTEFRRTLQRYMPPFMWRIRAGMMDFREGFYPAVTDNSSPVAAFFRNQTQDMMKASFPDDEEMREKLTPKYAIGCKRVCISDDYYPTLTRSNVTLQTDSITRITETGITSTSASGAETTEDFDLIVYATGFKTTQFLHPINLTGASSTSLASLWSGGAYAYQGVTIPSIPNFAMLYGPNTNLGHNSIILMIEAQSKYIATLARAVLDARMRSPTAADADVMTPTAHDTSRSIALSPKADVTAAYNEKIQAVLSKSSFADPACASWYKDPETGRITNNWSGTVIEYQKMMSGVNWEDFEDGDVVSDMRGKTEEGWKRVREESLLSDRTLIWGGAVLAGAAAVGSVLARTGGGLGGVLQSLRVR